MKRRGFLVGSMGFSAATLLGTRARAAATCSSVANPYDGPLYITLLANLGWDPTLLCDPKPNLSNVYTKAGPIPPQPGVALPQLAHAGVGKVGNISFAKVSVNGVPFVENFFTRFAPNMTVLNGMDFETNNHPAGQRYVFSGRLSMADHHPSFGALVAAAQASQKAMPFITLGGFDYTAGIVAPTRLGTEAALRSVASPNRVIVTGYSPDPANLAAYNYFTDATRARIKAAQAARTSAQAAVALPRDQRMLATLQNARGGQGEMAQFVDCMPATLDSGDHGFRGQIQTAMSAYRAGITASISVGFGNFDSHSTHDAWQIPSLQGLLDTATFIMDQAQAMGIANKVVLIIGSDFGRTPEYNKEKSNWGKDHWNVSSVMVIAPPQLVPGNRVIGGSTDGHLALKVNPKTLATVTADDPSGIALKPGHLHAALRRLAGIDQTALAQRFPLAVDTLPLLS